MEIAQVGNHVLSACPYCDELFDHQIPGGGFMDSYNAIKAMHEKHLAANPGCKARRDAVPPFDELAAALRPCFQAADEKRRERLANHPDNGKHGYWRVTGLRHHATTRASSAQEAVDKCSERVNDWEGPEAVFIGEELPDVF